jgi:hypothetical protein
MERVMIVQYSPKPEDALAHVAFMNPNDIGAPYVYVGRFVYRCGAHPDVSKGHIALNAAQRRENMKVAGERIFVYDFLMPMRNFDIKSVTLEATWLIGSSARFPVAMTDLANKFRTQFEGHVLSPRQILIMDVEDDKMLFTVKSNERGLLTMQSEVGIQWVG